MHVTTFLALVLIASCSNGSDTIDEIPPPTDGVASVAVMLTVQDIDPTSDIGDPLVTAAEFTISTVEIVYDDGTRHTVSTASRTLDMLAPTAPITLGAAAVPVGTITSVEIQVDAATVMRDGELLAVDVLGAGIIAVVPAVDAVLGCTTLVTTEFDPNTSFDFVPAPDPDPVPDECDHVFDFEGLPTGTFLSTQLAPAVTVSCDNARAAGPDDCLIFNSGAPTGGDDDLATGHGNLVIIAENVVDSDGDGLVDDPDDEASGGVQVYTFSPPVDVDSVFIVDIDLDEVSGFVVATDADGVVTTRVLPPIGNASTQTIDLRAENVARLEVHLPSSGGVDEIAYHVDCDGPGEPGPGSFDFTPMFAFLGAELLCEALPPDPALIAPPLNPYVITSFADRNRFLFESVPPVQTGLDMTMVDSTRLAVLRGVVHDVDGQPLPGVSVRAAGADFGQTKSRMDGRYDFAAEGGGAVTLEFRRDGYLPLQRTTQTPWNQYVEVDPVVMTALDPNVTAVDFPVGSGLVARGSTVTDLDGSRTATLFFEPGTSATLEYTDGTSAAADTLNVRLTEYTVGERGPEAMPAALPPTSAYTYAVEVSADEALGEDVARVTFDQPVPLYVDNFIGFPVGTDVPTGFYDRTVRQWIPIEDGRVIEIVGVSGGAAEVDLDGDGSADDPALLAISTAELAQLATTYNVGDELWRVTLDHFTPIDCNFPFLLPYPPPLGPLLLDESADNACLAQGSIIECENQILRESVAIAGVPHALVYSSYSATGHRAEDTLRIQLTPDTVDPLLDHVGLRIEVAGRSFDWTFPPMPALSHQFQWDGLDSYGREIVGAVAFKVTVEHFYPTLYQAPPPEAVSSFARVGSPTASLGWDFCRLNPSGGCMLGAVSTLFYGTLGNVRAGADLGGWGLSGHHHLDTTTGTLLGGDGERHTGQNNGLRTLVGGGGDATANNGDLATGLEITRNVRGLAGAPDGSTYVLVDRAGTADGAIWRIGLDGLVEVHALDPAIGALVLSNSKSLAAGPNGEIYYAVFLVDITTFTLSSAVFRHDPTGPDPLVAGLGAALGTDGSYEGPADGVAFHQIGAIAADRAGNVTIGETAPGIQSSYIWLVTPGGHIARLAGREGALGDDGDDGPAADAGLSIVLDMAVAPNGDLYFIGSGLNATIRRIDTSGTITNIGGTANGGFNLEGQLAADVRLSPSSLAVDAAGEVLFSQYDGKIYEIDSAGVLHHVAGSLDIGSSDDEYEDGMVPQLAPLDELGPMALDSLGRLIFVDGFNPSAINQVRVARIEHPVGPGEVAYFIPNADHTEVYEFDVGGLHRRTYEPETGAVLTTFDYDPVGRVIASTDSEGNVTTIERDANGLATRIVGPFGHITTLTHDANAYLASITNDEAQSVTLETRSDGLLLG